MGVIISLLHLYTTAFSVPAGEKKRSALKQDPGSALANELKGRRMHVDMSKSFEHWPSGARHPEYERLLVETNRVLDIACPDPKRCKKFKMSDFASFSCIWWPYAEWEDLYTAMLYSVCLFVWDDTIDTNEHFLATDLEEANLWRKQSLAYFKYHLRLSSSEKEPICPDNVCLLFKEFGERFCARFGEVQRRRLFSKIEHFVEANRLEQIERLSGRLPNYQEYMQIRYAVTGCRMFTLLLEITNHTTLPSWVIDSDEMEQVVKECNFIIIVVNDILSLKKEIATDCVVNAVPVLFKSGLSLDHAIAYLTDEMHAARDRLDAMAEKLDQMTKNDAQLNEDVHKFINGIRIMDTGTLIYSIESPRYGVVQYLQPDGSLDIVL